MQEHEKINYVEFPCRNLSATKAFFEADLAASTGNGSALIVFYSARLEETLGKVEKAGGRIIKPIFSFPGGRRFHFTEPSGNEFAVWGEAA